ERGLSCAILVRSNKRARETADFLRHEFPAVAVEVDAEVQLALDNPAGVALLDLFRWLAHPGDRMAWGHVAHSPLRLALKPDDEPGSWRDYRDLINREGISGVIGQFFQTLRAAGSLTPFLEQRLEGIAREAHAYDETGDRSPESWLRRLEGLVQREYSSEGAIQIMTIHKAKGLEFDMVVAMDLAGGAFDDPSKAGILEFRDAAGLTGALLLPPKKEMLTADRDLRKLYEQWVADQCVERFCNLYVALTRARHATYVLLPKAPKNAPASEMRHDLWIRDAVGDAGEVVTWDGREWPALDLTGDAGWHERLHKTLPEEFVAEPPTLLGAAVPRRPRARPAGHHHPLSADSLEFGLAVHRAFEKTGWVDEELSPFPADPAEVLVFELLEIPEIRTRFERQSRSIELFREQPVDAILAGEWLSGVIDRLQVEKDETGAVTRVEVIDFKTDAIDSAEELAARYQSQMTAYREALAVAFHPAPVSCLLLSTHLRCWVEMP
ncbi:MAG: restriction endonuclease type ii-like, partial [Akkermansiaceae bacterium]|nr:restriction endonuclease type ii-like [Akkermansiaceae bacterium]